MDNSEFRENKPGWPEEYYGAISRNIGTVSYEEQERIRTASIAVLGVGGLGGPLTEMLVRAGCENLTIVDRDRFEISNLNRQLCLRKDLGKFKVDVIEERMKEINPRVRIRKYYRLGADNIGDILNGIDIAVLTLDGPLGSIIAAKKCRDLGIPMLEGWGIPYLFCWWFMPDGKTYEEVYGVPELKEVSADRIEKMEEKASSIKKRLIDMLLRFPGIKEFYTNEPGAFDAMMNGRIGLRSFAPVIWMSASYICFNLFFSGILDRIPKHIAPTIKAFDYMRFRIVEFNPFT